MVETVDTIIVGGGQAGLAISEHLTRCGVAHLILERGRIAENWRSQRWDSLVANGPAWHDRFPGMEFPKTDPDAFASKEKVADYFVAYADKMSAPVRCGVEVQSVRRKSMQLGFEVATSHGIFEASNVVAATGPFQIGVVPKIVPQDADILQLHSSGYRNPGQIPEGAVLVVGAGSSGTQIADELLQAGKRVYLSVGAHDRPPRAYRGRDFCWWLGVLGKWSLETRASGSEHVTIAVSGSRGGYTVDFRRLAAQGITLLGQTALYKDSTLIFAEDLRENIAGGDASYIALLDEADAYVRRYGLDLAEEPEARKLEPDPECLANPITRLNLAEAQVSTIIWATGFAANYGWLEVNVFDDAGRPKHQRGVSAEPGLYFLGLPWQSRRASSFIWGVWHDAKFLADHIITQKKYLAYHAGDPGRT